MHHLDRYFFRPRSIAIVGASQDKKKLGNHVVRNVLEGGYTGAVYPVNPKGGRMYGHHIYPSLSAIEHGVDVVVIVVPASLVVGVLEEMGLLGYKRAVVISAGFAESGKEGKRRERAVQECCARHGITLLGPNVLGYMVPSARLNCSFGPDMPKSGEVALLSQSGAFMVGMVDWARKEGIGFSWLLSLGNKAVVSEVAGLEWALQDARTKVVVCYLESVEAGDVFMAVAGQVAQTKPVIIYKGGRSKASAQAISSHTGRIAGDDQLFTAFCDARGIMRANSLDEVWDLVLLCQRYKTVAGKRLAVVTNAGGLGVMTMDMMDEVGIQPVTIGATLQKHMAQALSPAASTANPIDILGDATSKEYAHVLECLLKDGRVDMVMVVLTPQTVTDVEEIARVLVRLARVYRDIPMVATFVGGERVERGIAILQRGGVVHVSSPQRGVCVLDALWRSGKGMAMQRSFSPVVMQGAPRVWTRQEVAVLMEQLELVVPPYLEVTQKVKVPSAWYPVAVKYDNAHVLHKTDVRGVYLNCASANGVQHAVKQLHSDTVVPYVLVEPMIQTPHLSCFVGCIRSAYGPLLVVGLGGIYTELFTDHCMIPGPWTASRIRQHIRSASWFPILQGYRGDSGYDTEELVQVVLRLGKWFMESPTVESIDVNPLFLHVKGATLVDIKITTRE